MRLAPAVLLLSLVLAGCSSSGGSPDLDEADAGRASQPAQGDAVALLAANGNGTPATSVHDGRLDAGVRPPLAMVLSGPHEQFAGTQVALDVGPDVVTLLLEIVWQETAGGVRQDLVLRALSATEHYWYGGGEGTPGDPAWVRIDDPEDHYDVTAFADLAGGQVDWTLHATAFRGGGMPDGFTAVA